MAICVAGSAGLEWLSLRWPNFVGYSQRMMLKKTVCSTLVPPFFGRHCVAFALISRHVEIDFAKSSMFLTFRNFLLHYKKLCTVSVPPSQWIYSWDFFPFKHFFMLAYVALSLPFFFNFNLFLKTITNFTYNLNAQLKCTIWPREKLNKITYFS